MPIETRLITKQTRPELYRAPDESQAANDNRLAARAYRRRHPIFAFIAYCSESVWRVAAMIACALLLGSLLDAVLP